MRALAPGIAALAAASGLFQPVAAAPSAADAAMLARDKALELRTAADPPPGDDRVYYAAGYAQVMCSAVFITGLKADFAAENVGYFTAPYAQRSRLGTPSIDYTQKSVSVQVPGGPLRTAKFVGDQGCVTLPVGSNTLDFKPSRVPRPPQPAAATPWPMGDASNYDAAAGGVDTQKLKQAVDAAFASPEGMTAAFVVTHRGHIIAERYAAGINLHTPLESWSMGKSVTATLMGILIRQGAYQLTQAAPIPEWQTAGDPRSKITIADILHMSSGLRIRAPYDPDFDPAGPYPEHFYLYTSGLDTFKYAASRQLQWPPNTVGRYRNTDPVLANYLIRMAVEKRGENYWSFPQRALFDKIGARSFVIETDPHGNFLLQGYDLAAARDWARLGNLYLQDGMWNGQRLLPEGFAQFVSTIAPAWAADGRPIYGGFFWINGDGALPVPKDTYFMAGAGGQYTFVIPSHQLVVVRLGHFKGAKAGDADLNRALALLMTAVPSVRRP